MVAVATCSVDELAALVRALRGFADLTDELLDNVLDLLAGRYPSEEFGELRPRIVWDRVGGTVGRATGPAAGRHERRHHPRPGAVRRVPARRHPGRRARRGDGLREPAGETFLLGASTWRIEDISFERVVVTPAPGEPGKMPFWHGDRPGRPLELGRALGAFLREVRELPPAAAEGAARPLRPRRLGRRQRGAVPERAGRGDRRGARRPHRRRRAVPGRDRRLAGLPAQPVRHARQHARGRWPSNAGSWSGTTCPVETMWSDDGIVIRLPEAADELPVEELLIDPEDIDELVVSTLPQTSLFSARFRECAARACSCPAAGPTPGPRSGSSASGPPTCWPWRPGTRASPSSWRPAASACRTCSTCRPCARCSVSCAAGRCAWSASTPPRRRRSRRACSSTGSPPTCTRATRRWPSGEPRRSALDRDLLRELLGAEELRELLDPGVLADLELELQCLTEGRRARTPTSSTTCCAAWATCPRPSSTSARRDGGREWTGDQLVAERRAIVVRIGAEERVIAAEDAGRYRDALGCAIPVGLPVAFTDPVARPLEQLVGRYARTHGPFLADASRPLRARRRARARALARWRRRSGSCGGSSGPTAWSGSGATTTCCASCAGARSPRCAVRSSRSSRRRWPGSYPPGTASGPAAGLDALVETLGLLQGAPLVASTLERDVLPARVLGYRPPTSTSCAPAASSCGSGPAPSARPMAACACASATSSPPARAPRRRSDEEPRPDGCARGDPGAPAGAGALVLEASSAGRRRAADTELLAALWDLVWAGEVTNDSLAPLRLLSGGRGRGAAGGQAASIATRPRGRPRPGRLSAIGPPAGAGRWSLVAPLLEPKPTPTEAAHVTALQLLERHGVLTRESVLAEGVPGGFTAVYGVLKVLEERGQVRRGYFVTGLGAAQFALPGAVDRLRSVREGPADPDGTDEDARAAHWCSPPPTRPSPTAPRWPGPSRPGGRLGRRDRSWSCWPGGRSCGWTAVGTTSCLFQRPAATPGPARWPALVKDGRLRSLEVRTVDGGQPVASSEVASGLRRVGFADGYRGLVLRGG